MSAPRNDSRHIKKKPLTEDTQLKHLKDELRAYAQILQPLAGWKVVFNYTCREQVAGDWITDAPNYAPNGGFAPGTTFRGTFGPSPPGSITTIYAQWEGRFGHTTSRPVLAINYVAALGAYQFIVSTPPGHPSQPPLTELYFGVEGVTSILPATIALRLEEYDTN